MAVVNPLRVTTLKGLRTKAGETTHRRGHYVRWEDRGPIRSHGVCTRCAMEVDVLLAPGSNEIAIGGEAVALTCDPYYRMKQAVNSFVTNLLDELDVRQERRYVVNSKVRTVLGFDNGTAWAHLPRR